MPAPIEDYALLGDLHTAALVSRSGAIDWLCLPRFDSPACFSALLHDESAGTWQLAPAGAGQATRRAYRGHSLVLAQEWDTGQGAVRVLDFMPPRTGSAAVVRIVEGIDGRVPMRMSLRPRFGYGSIRPWIRPEERGFEAVAGPDAVWLDTTVPLTHRGCATYAEFDVRTGERFSFVLAYRPSHLPRPEPVDAGDALADTEKFWADWIGRCRYRGRWPDAVRRALITLKALTYEPTGGILAAPTTSLPEELGGERNWDYRYCWLRDATFALQALVGTGYADEARAWREWLVRAVAGDPADLQVLYRLDGARRVPESTLDWLAGYRGSAPVRIGNAAAGQVQLDVWGEVLDGLHLVREAGLSVTHPAWDLQRGLLDFLEGHWDQPDHSLWEVRGKPQHFVHSKVMAWAGADRAVRTVERHRLDGPVSRWRALRDRIHAEVCQEGYDVDRGTFTQFYGSRGLDAALLLMPRVGFLPSDDPRIRGTVLAVRDALSEDGFVRRYGPDADGGRELRGSEGAFLPCSFWLADGLHGIGRRDEAREIFERMLAVRNDVGLLSEEYDVAAGRQLGNMPQAFSMVGLVNTARLLDGAETATHATGAQQALRQRGEP
ncbi:glycoside hydrolase family 15 protein [Amycolatopsis benzoatilytica]|uniref:glycoside hydrolase family 15 protein n=1 Tax=Amycolatopsis benzoatilytica TaxID=346045 RepID=UPI00036D2B56|nr:glycoside hydrolase family 15 protein [Amycolatopsis benzoatilytica]